MGIFECSSDGDTKMIPSLEISFIKNFLDVYEWWEQIVFILPPDNLTLTRKKIILDATNKDGGGAC